MATLIARFKDRREKSAEIVYTAVDDGRKTDEAPDGASKSETFLRPVPNWPTEPRVLERSSWLTLIGDLCLVLLPLPFIVLAIGAWRLNAKEASEQGQFVLRSMQLGPTIYPLIFAGVGGRCLKNIGRRKAELGTRLEVLEKLIGSQSFVSAVTTAVALRSTSLLSICLLVLWALSPIGGQSSLRLLYETNSTIVGHNRVYYSAPDSHFQVFANISLFQIPGIAVGASLAASQQVLSGAHDLWGHAKVPQLDLGRLADKSSAEKEAGWVSVEDVLRLDNDSQAYTSLTGFNVQGLIPGRRATFNMDYGYLDLSCERLFVVTPKVAMEYVNQSEIYLAPSLKGTSSYTTSTKAWDYLSNRTIYLGEPSVSSISGLPGRSFFKVAFNSTDPYMNSSKYGLWNNLKTHNTYFLYGVYDEIQIGPDQPDPVSRPLLRQDVHLFQCKPTHVMLELYTACDSSGRCNVEKVRRTSGQYPYSLQDCAGRARYGALTCLTRSYGITHDLFELWDTVFAIQGSSSLLTDYTKRQSGTPYDRGHTEGRAPWVNVTATQVSMRLTTLLNTFLQANAWTQQVTRWAPFAIPDDALPEETYPGSPAVAARFPRMHNVTATNEYQVPVYRVNVAWVLTLLFTTTVLVVLAIVNLVISYLILAPDIFGYVSSLTRESVKILAGPQQDGEASLGGLENLGESGTVLDGAQRARLLKDLIVRVEDVRPEEDVGCISVRLYSDIHDGSTKMSGILKEGRVYV